MRNLMARVLRWALFGRPGTTAHTGSAQYAAPPVPVPAPAPGWPVAGEPLYGGLGIGFPYGMAHLRLQACQGKVGR